MFLALARTEERVKRKDYVYGIGDVGAAKAWPLSVFAGCRLINDAVVPLEVVLIGDQAPRSVRSYVRKGHRTEASDRVRETKDPGGLWRVTVAALIACFIRPRRRVSRFQTPGL